MRVKTVKAAGKIHQLLQSINKERNFSIFNVGLKTLWNFNLSLYAGTFTRERTKSKIAFTIWWTHIETFTKIFKLLNIRLELLISDVNEHGAIAFGGFNRYDKTSEPLLLSLWINLCLSTSGELKIAISLWQ